MARYKGTFKAAANYEPQIAAPFDARMLVEARADLTLRATWAQLNGDVWTYPGMIVTVASDVNPANNGLYMLMSEDYTLDSNWRKMASATDIADLQSQIDEIEGSLSVEVEAEADLPLEGEEDTTYFVKENFSIQRWDESTQSYVSYGGAPDLDISIINGGNSNGN